MKFKEKYNVSEEFSSLFEFKSETDELKHDAYMLMFKFLSEIERVNEYSIYKKDLAKAINTSASFISQLFAGNKLANLVTLVKLQKAYNLTFDVIAKSNQEQSFSVILPEKPKSDSSENFLDFMYAIPGRQSYEQKVS